MFNPGVFRILAMPLERRVYIYILWEASKGFLEYQLPLHESFQHCIHKIECIVRLISHATVVTKHLAKWFSFVQG